MALSAVPRALRAFDFVRCTRENDETMIASLILRARMWKHWVASRCSLLPYEGQTTTLYFSGVIVKLGHSGKKYYWGTDQTTVLHAVAYLIYM